MNDVSSTSPSTGPQEHSNPVSPMSEPRRPLPLFLWVLVGYLLADTLIRIVQITMSGSEGGDPWFLYEERFLHLVTATFSLLLAVQVWFRTFAARIWGSAYFMLQVFYFVSLYAIRRPDEWLILTTVGRIQVVCQALFFLVSLVLINLPPVSRALAPRPIYGWPPRVE